MIKIDFEFDSEYGVFRDAIYLPEDHALTDAEIEAMKQQRFDNWVDAVTNPPQVEEVAVPIEGGPITIGEETYEKLNGVPPSGAKLIEINGVWYYRV